MALSVPVFSTSGGYAPGGTLPAFKVVTGISTGSILATFAFTGDTQVLVGKNGYGIDHEGQLLKPYLRKGDTLMTLLSVPNVLKHGAVADLDPLLRQLLGVLDYGTLHKVADGARGGRLLMVGAVDVDTARAVAFDLTEMALRIDAEHDRALREADPKVRKPIDAHAEQLRNCYARAILASSSAPLAAPPVFIDRIMYVDGGARFGVFSDDVGSPIHAREAHEPLPAPKASLYVIVNGTLGLEPVCGYEKDKNGRCDPKANHAKWSLPNLGMRSLDILEHQVYTLSVERIIRRSDASHHYRMAQIRPDSETHWFAMPPELKSLGEGRRTCAQWATIDEDDRHPLQFQAAYMHCLIDYGRERMASDLKWDAT